jgi:hypothetical protein
MEGWRQRRLGSTGTIWKKRKERTLDTLLPARSVWVEPLDYERAVVVDAERQRKQNKTTRGSEWRSVLKKKLARVSIVRDGRFAR